MVFRVMIPGSLRSPGYAQRGYSGDSVLPFNLVLQHPDLLDLELDRIAVFQVPADFKSATIADRAGADEFAGHQGFVLGHMLDDLLEREQHAVGDALRAHLAVHPHFHLQFVGIADLVRCHDPGTHDVAAVKTLAFGGTEAAFHLDALRVARREIVEDRIAEDVILGLRGGNVGALVPGDDAELEFVIHHLAVARPLYRGVGAAHAEAVGDVVDRLLAIDFRQFAERLGIEPRQFGHVVFGAGCKLELAARRLQDMQRKRHAVAHLPRLGDRGEDFGGGDTLPTAFSSLPFLSNNALACIQRGRTGVDQRQHRCESRIALARRDPPQPPDRTACESLPWTRPIFSRPPDRNVASFTIASTCILIKYMI